MSAASPQATCVETEFAGTYRVTSRASATKVSEQWHQCKFAWVTTPAPKQQALFTITKF